MNDLFQQYAQTVISVLTAAGLVLAGIAAAHRKVVRPFMQRMDAMAELANYQLRPNSGHSLVDMVKQIGPNHEEAKEQWSRLALADMEIREHIDDAVDDLRMRLVYLEEKIPTKEGGLE